MMLFCGCAETAPSAATAIAEALCGVEPSLPSGTLYAYAIENTEAELLTDAMLASMFGDGRVPSELDEALTGACYLSHAHPFEITVFCAKSRHGAQILSQMLLRRGAILERYWSEQGYEDYISNINVTVCGNWVLLSVTRDPDAALRRFRQAV